MPVVREPSPITAMIFMVFVFQALGFGKRCCRGDGGSAVPDIEGVIDAFLPFGKSAETAPRPQGGKLVLAAGDNLVRIGLMADIPDQFIFRRVENKMHRQRQFHGAQRRGQVTAVGRDRVDDQPADFLGQFIEFSKAQSAKIRGSLTFASTL